MEPVGIPKEIKKNEGRVALTPKGVEVLTRRGIPVFVERSAGLKAGFKDEEYEKAGNGACVLTDAAGVWQNARVIKKVKEPLSSEFRYFESGKVLFTFLHLASQEQCELVKALVSSGISAIGYETVELQGYTPLLKPMSIAAGMLGAYFAGIYRNLAEVSGDTVRLSSTVKDIVAQVTQAFPEVPIGFPPGNVVVIGGGQAGLAAAQMAAQMRGKVTIVESSPHRRQYLTVYIKDRELPVIIEDGNKDYLDYLYDADVIIGAVHKPGNRAPEIISKSLLKEISQGHRKLIIDIAIDQGGNIAESRPTSYDDPLYLDSFKNIRFAVTNMPGICPRQTSLMLEEATLDYTLALAEGLDKAFSKYPELRTGLNVHKRALTHPAVIEAHQYKAKTDN